jgi:hypothetical protein
MFLFRSFCCKSKFGNIWLTLCQVSTKFGLIYTEVLNPLTTEYFCEERGSLLFKGFQAITVRPSDNDRMTVKSYGGE